MTEFEFRLHEVGPMVRLGLIFWPLDQGADVLRLARDVIPALPRTINVLTVGMNAPPAPFVPEPYRMQPGYALAGGGFGSPEEHAAVMAQFREALPPLWEFADMLPYVALRQMLDEANAWGLYSYDRSAYLEDLSDEAIEAITEHVPGKISPLTIVALYRLDGAYSDVGEDDTAFGGGRSPRYAVFIIGVCPAPEMLPAERAWVRSTWDVLQPHAVGSGYVNAVDAADRVQAIYGPKYERLAGIKGQYDPDNVFHRNTNIKPA